MNFVGRILNRFVYFKRLRAASINGNAIKSACRYVSIAGTLLKNKSIFVVYNDDHQFVEISSIMELEGANVIGASLLKDLRSCDYQFNVDFLILVIRWTPTTEMMRLKTISKESYDNFYNRYADTILNIANHVISTNHKAQIISFCPSFAFDKKNGYTLYGIVGNYLINRLRLLSDRNIQSKYIDVRYGNAMNEQISAVLILLISHIEKIGNQRLHIGTEISSGNENSLFNGNVFNEKDGSACGGTLADANVIFVYNDKELFLCLDNRFRQEGCYCSSIYSTNVINESDLSNVISGMTGPCDVIVNIVKGSQTLNPITQIYQLLQVESPFLTLQHRQASICNVYVAEDIETIKMYGLPIEYLNNSLAQLLRNHHYVVNGIITDGSANPDEISRVSAFLCSKNGKVLTGETIHIV